jgi:hypothetical protein
MCSVKKSANIHMLIKFPIWREHRMLLRPLNISAKEQILRDPSGGLVPMFKLASARKSLLNSQKFSRCFILGVRPIYRLLDEHWEHS